MRPETHVFLSGKRFCNRIKHIFRILWSYALESRPLTPKGFPTWNSGAHQSAKEISFLNATRMKINGHIYFSNDDWSALCDVLRDCATRFWIFPSRTSRGDPGPSDSKTNGAIPQHVAHHGPIAVGKVEILNDGRKRKHRHAKEMH